MDDGSPWEALFQDIEFTSLICWNLIPSLDIIFSPIQHNIARQFYEKTYDNHPLEIWKSNWLGLTLLLEVAAFHIQVTDGYCRLYIGGMVLDIDVMDAPIV